LSLPLGDGWELWGDLELRGAGFPADWLLRLGAPAAAAAAERALAAERELGEVRDALARALEEARERAAASERPALGRALGRLRKGQTVALADGHPAGAAAARWNAALARASAARHEAAAAHAEATREISAALRDVAADRRFREALAWQNRHALRTGVDPLLRMPPGASNSSARQKEQLIAGYLQRYCAKNDRIGFFGPQGWGALAAQGPAISVRPGPSLLARRVVRLEGWAIDALGDRLSEDGELRAAVAPRRMPTIRLEGQTLHHPIERVSELPLEYARLLAACDGEASARRIAAALASDPELDLSGEEEVLDMLAELADRRLVIWRLDPPTSGGRPEDLLRAEIERVDPGPWRERALSALGELEAARDRVAQAAGDPDRLERALDDLDGTFERLTGSAASREHGRTYAGRTVAFEMCQRDVELVVGPDLWQRAAGPLRLLLLSARWFTHEIAARYRAALREVHRRLRAGRGDAVEYLTMAAELPALFPGGDQPGSIVRQVVTEMQARWRELLGVRGNERVVRRSAAELEPAVAASFPAPGPGWPAARHQSIDLLVAAASAADAAGGDLQVVLGEIHPGMNVLLIPDLPHPDPPALFERRDREIGAPCVAPVWSRARTHVDYYSQSRIDLDLEGSTARSWRPREQVLAAAELLVEERGDTLWVRTRDGRVCFEVIAFLEHHLIAESHQQFRLLGGAPHLPRVEVDGVVLARERWAPAPGEVAFASAGSAAERFAGARAWAARLGLPRFVFLRTAEEIKPTYVDLESPIYVELAAKAIRRASSMSISEMVPSFDRIWLPDADGRRYTSEIRIVAVDPRRWSPPSP